MTSKGIAQRLIAKYGQQDATAKVQDKLKAIASVEFRAGDAIFVGRKRWRAIIAKHTARQLLWNAVQNHLTRA